ncbi:MAG TPA: hypothetical protein VFT38_18975, partial [Vicinamibacteria bacterium]|nr:hypothetical protein [Vicinamibacteria bacterium]
MKGRWRSAAGLTLALPAGVAALLLASSPPTYPLWVAHFLCLELSLAAAAVAALALLVTVGVTGRVAAVARLVAVPALIVALMPALVVVSLYRE